MNQTKQLLPEWFEQEAVVLAWPDEQTDWQPWLTLVEQTYLSLIQAISKTCGVVLLARPNQHAHIKQLLQSLIGPKVLIVAADYNDTWIRDYGFLTCKSEHGMLPIEFTFNGWGQKFDARKDNTINQTCLAQLCQHSIITVETVAEGGAIEIDQAGCLLSTELCLSNPKRNGDLSLEGTSTQFKTHLGAQKVCILQHGHLEGDDTDGHIDTLVRFTANKGLVIQSAYNNKQDTHYSELVKLVEECASVMPEHEIFELPLPHIENNDGERLPASYANYLINNGQILAPIYQQPEDTIALKVLAKAYPTFTIVPIDSLPLIQQFGSIHCISMQVPTGTLKSDVITQLNTGVSVYAAE